MKKSNYIYERKKTKTRKLNYISGFFECIAKVKELSDRSEETKA